jgi:hypothetical protein
MVRGADCRGVASLAHRGVVGYVSVPLFQFLLIRWYFRLFIWARFLWQVARLDLSLVPTHPDRVGGLGFLANTVYAFVPLAVAHGALLAGLLANRIFYMGAALPEFKAEIAVLVVSVQMPRAPLPVGIQRLEKLLQERVGDSRTRLVIRVINSVDISSKGRILLGQAHFGEQPTEEVAMQEALEQAALAGIEQIPNLFVINIDAAKSAAGWAVRAEVVGPRVPSPAEARTLETTLQKLAGRPVTVSLWARTEVVVTGQRYSSVKEQTEAAANRNTPAASPAPETSTETQP